MPVAHGNTDRGPASSGTAWPGPAVNDGPSFTGVTAMVNVCGALVSSPTLAVPPPSDSITLTVATPVALAASVYVRVAWAARGGWPLKRALLLFVTLKVTDCPDSSAGPALIDVAQLGMLCAGASSNS